MYLLYLDDSGSANNPNEEYLVLGGISVFERRVYFLSKQLDELAAKYHAADPDSVEFHASEIFRGKTHPWGELKTPSVRKQVLHEVLQVLADDRYGTCAFACAVHKKSFPNDDPMKLAFEELCNRFDLQLERLRIQGEKHRGLIILDKSTHETALQQLTKDFRAKGTRWRALKNIADVPLFLNSDASRCIQLADHVAYAVFRRYQAGDTSYLDPIVHKFDADDTRIHGLVHKQVLMPNCRCHACMSKSTPIV
jgi:hypothetical protein